MATRTLNVKKTNKLEIQLMWGLPLPNVYPFLMYVRCNAKGEINWDKAPIFKPEELVKRNNVKIID